MKMGGTASHDMLDTPGEEVWGSVGAFPELHDKCAPGRELPAFFSRGWQHVGD